MEVIQQKVHLLDGVPACKAGEWVGIKSSHWNSSKRVLKSLDKKEKRNISMICGDMKNYFTDNKIKSLARSEEFNLKPAVRKIAVIREIDDDTNIKRGRKFLVPLYTDPKVYHPKLLDDIVTIREEKVHCLRQFGEDRKVCKNEVLVEQLMGGKKRLPSLQAMRNSLPVFSPGDKDYRNVDCSPDFFNEGGLVVGSTNKINYNKTKGKRSDNFFDSMDLNVHVLNKDKLWKNKVFKENLDFDKGYVNNLKIWEDVYLMPYIPPQDKKAGTAQNSQNKNNTVNIKKK